jgi:hypothetical protein
MKQQEYTRQEYYGDSLGGTKKTGVQVLPTELISS